jgi:hypothetical protein
VFGGSNWRIDDLAGPSLYFDRKIYSMIDTASHCEQAIEALASVSEDELHSTARDIPSEWFGPTDFDHLVQLFTILYKRRERMRSLVAERLELVALNTLRKPNRSQQDLQLEIEDFQTVKFEATLIDSPAPVAS